MRRRTISSAVNRLEHAKLLGADVPADIPTTVAPIDELSRFLDPKMLAGLTEAELILLRQCVEELAVDGHSNTASALISEDYKWEPVSMAHFMHDEYYFGHPELAGKMYPKVKSAVIDTLDRPNRPLELVLGGAIGWGKGGRADDHVLTPSGWTRYRDLCVGSQVVGSDGSAVTVTGVFPRGVLPVYRVTFNDGASVVVDGDHLWAVRSPKDAVKHKAYSTRSTRSLFESGVANARGQLRWHIPVLSSPVVHPSADVPLPPYVVGALLGDGGLTGDTPILSTSDPYILERVKSECGIGSSHRSGVDYRLTNGRSKVPNKVMAACRSLGMCCYSYEKRVPRIYMTGSVDQRLDLLRGLLDTDGWVQDGRARFCSTSRGLADDVVQLVRSLGGIAKLFSKPGPNRPSYTVQINITVCPFALPRKGEKWRPNIKYRPSRMIESITRVDDAEVICIAVDAPDKLYVTEDYIVTHNTTAMAIVLLYLVYRLTCLRSPHNYYGLTKGSSIVIGLYSVSLDQAMDTSFGKLMNWIDEIPYFREKCPRVKRISARIRFADSPVEVIAGSREIHTIGKDLFAVGIDEANFMTAKNGDVDEGVAYAIYTGVRNRLKSRFITSTGEPAGMAIIASSKRTKASFVEEHVKASGPEIAAGRVVVFSYNQWEVRPRALYVKPKFHVEIGDRIRPSRILKPGESPRVGAETIEVPGEYRTEFEQDIDKSLRELAGIATESLLPLLHDKEAVSRCETATHVHPFSRESFSISTADDIGIDAFFLPQAMFRIVRSRYVMRVNPQCARFIHCDIGITGDALGLCMAHISGFRTVRRIRSDGTWYEDKAPIFTVDFMVQIKPPMGAEIDLAKVRAFIISLRDYGVPIWRVSFDGFQSTDSKQILRKLGFDAVCYSVDRTDEAYLSLRQALVENRLVLYPHPVFQREIVELERDLDNCKVDHPAKSPSTGQPGSKDVSDAVAGAVFNALIEKRLLPGMGIPSTTSSDNVAAGVEVNGGTHLWNDLDREVRA